MIKPATLWGLMKSCDDDEWIGRICRALGGQDVELDYGQQQMVNSIKMDSGWMDERIEEQRERWRRQKRDQRGQYRTNADNADLSAVRECPPPSVPPSVRPSIHPKETINRSVTVPPKQPKTERNENGTGLRLEGGVSNAKRLAEEFVRAARKDESAFFSPDYDVVTVILGVTGDYKSINRWRQLVKEKGDGEVRDETFSFWREISSGEDVSNRGATLNRRLSKLPNKWA